MIQEPVEKIIERFAVEFITCNAQAAAECFGEISLRIGIHAKNLFPFIAHQVGKIGGRYGLPVPPFSMAIVIIFADIEQFLISVKTVMCGCVCQFLLLQFAIPFLSYDLFFLPFCFYRVSLFLIIRFYHTLTAEYVETYP